jgi:two-component system NtrC family sensor kinase
MRVATKIICFVFFGTIILLTIDGYFSFRREVELFDSRMSRDAQLLGTAIKGLVSDIWETHGQSRALEFVEQANTDIHPMEIRWIRTDASPGDPFEARIPKEKLAQVMHGQEVFPRKAGKEGALNLYTYILVSVGDETRGALELSEPLSDAKAYIHESIVRQIVIACLLALLSGFILLLFNNRVIGRPLKQLVEKTRRIGAGDFSGDLVLPGKDELSKLASAMNRMCEQLTAAREAILVETEARISALEQLRHTERLATLGRLSSGIAHELGTPLNVVSGRAKIIATEDLKRKEIAEYAGIIMKQAEQMTIIIQQLLHFARRKEPKKSDVNLYNMVSQVLEMLNPIARKQRVTFNLVKNTLLIEPIIDKSQIQQVLMNLIMNGIQAMPNGGQLKIEIYLERIRPLSRKDVQEKEFLVLCIVDQGEGISEDNINHIFDPFFTTKDVGKGTGLGLSIALGIVQEHGGWIDVTSKIGEGACFTIYLPVEASECMEES